MPPVDPDPATLPNIECDVPRGELAEPTEPRRAEVPDVVLLLFEAEVNVIVGIGDTGDLRSVRPSPDARAVAPAPEGAFVVVGEDIGDARLFFEDAEFAVGDVWTGLNAEPEEVDELP